MNAGPIIHPPLITMNAARWSTLLDIHKRHAGRDAPRHLMRSACASPCVEAVGYRARISAADHYAKEAIWAARTTG
jgi:hypothetical protein